MQTLGQPQKKKKKRSKTDVLRKERKWNIWNVQLKQYMAEKDWKTRIGTKVRARNKHSDEHGRC